ncbi:hypothetical protein P154DRAFT_562604 [Amniculicola lignicola CBS 123094]|uniref:Uncharacterized protein n=1 Tax=Amniculicola lignicola CBS 123094 TaxID=1392246 RepID=A0A6A5WI93_9PLEO|nr:hypothetical protein P154DRAFT_562604 [Amniculicola lignicola CBS 123094]
MCKVILFKFACLHTVKSGRSKCRGTFHRAHPSGKTAACSANCYMSFKLPMDCAMCQREVWEASWKQKLERAKAFRSKVKELDLPGEQVISEQIQSLENDFDKAAWNARALFPLGDRKLFQKPLMGARVAIGSPLSREVLPGEVIEPVNKEINSNPSSPFVSEAIDYSDLLGVTDNDWVTDEFLQVDTDTDLEYSEFSLDHSSFGFDPSPTVDSFETFGWDSDAGADWNNSQDLTAWGMDTGTTSIGIIDFQGLNADNESAIRGDLFDQVMILFNQTIGNDSEHQDSVQIPPTQDEAMIDLISELAHFSWSMTSRDPTRTQDQGHSQAQSQNQSTPQPQIWTDGLSEGPKLSDFDKFRIHLRAHKGEGEWADLTKWNTKWLQVARIELRKKETPVGFGGRRILSPSRKDRY